MDPRGFDRLAKSLSAAGTRRALLGLLTALPFAGGLAAILDLNETAATRRRTAQRRRQRRATAQHDRHLSAQKKKGGKKKKKTAKTPPPAPSCVSQSAAQTCTGKCGQVANNCGGPVDCGSCVCSPACPLCQGCNSATGRCDPTPAFLGLVCGAPGQVCQSDGGCTCDDGSCAAGQRCNGLACICDGTSCPTGCCDRTQTCHIGDDDACGIGGGACTRCIATGATCGGGTPGQCGCTSQGCGSQTCGAIVDNCGQPMACNGCAGCCDGNTCRAGTSRSACGTGVAACQVCDGVCESGTCTACSATNRCPAGMFCADGTCLEDCPTCQHSNNFRECVIDGAQDGTTCPVAAGGVGVCAQGACCAGCLDANDECGACRVFVTRTAYTGNLGGLDGADANCQGRATVVGLPGTYQAWLSDSTGSPATRFRCTEAACSSEGYALVNGVTIANDWNDLTDGLLDAAINLTELNQLPSSLQVWTNIMTNGTRGGVGIGNNHCQNWTSGNVFPDQGDGGICSNTDPSWTFGVTLNCDSTARLYCFQQS